MTMGMSAVGIAASEAPIQPKSATARVASFQFQESGIDQKIVEVRDRLDRLETGAANSRQQLLENDQQLQAVAEQSAALQQQSKKLTRAGRVATFTAVAGTASLLGGAVLLFFSPLVGGAFALAGMAAAVGGSRYMCGNSHQHTVLAMRSVKLLMELQSRALMHEALSAAIQAAHKEASGLEAELKALGGQRDVVKAARTLNEQPVLSVRIEDDYIMVGNIRVPRKSST